MIRTIHRLAAIVLVATPLLTPAHAQPSAAPVTYACPAPTDIVVKKTAPTPSSQPGIEYSAVTADGKHWRGEEWRADDVRIDAQHTTFKAGHVNQANTVVMCDYENKRPDASPTGMRLSFDKGGEVIATGDAWAESAAGRECKAADPLQCTFR